MLFKEVIYSCVDGVEFLTMHRPNRCLDSHKPNGYVHSSSRAQSEI